MLLLAVFLCVAAAAGAAADSIVVPVRVSPNTPYLFTPSAASGYCASFAFNMPANASGRIRVAWAPAVAGAVTIAWGDTVPATNGTPSTPCRTPDSKVDKISASSVPVEPVTGNGTGSQIIETTLDCYLAPATIFVSFATQWDVPNPNLLNSTTPRTLSFNLTTEAPRNPCLQFAGTSTTSTSATATATATATSSRPAAAGRMGFSVWTVALGAALAVASLA
ncbi:hypothetical protein DFJ74DRAFT_713705 [Hyaloraphidium curvatum]|nr:hypothetical protein DFJ74DRAFT_713705 [Hyaloraphidium curvatum]